jgi:hypothetical protein
MVILEGSIYFPMATKTWPCHPTSALKGKNRKAQGNALGQIRITLLSPERAIYFTNILEIYYIL